MDADRKPPSLLGGFATEFGLLCVLGILVALAMTPLLHFDFLRRFDRTVSDLLMRELAEERLIAPDPKAPRVVFLDIDEQSCEEWAAATGTSCTKTWSTPRDELADMLEAIAAASGKAQTTPRLLVIDVELSPLAHQDQDDTIADRLCLAAAHIAQTTPVIALRPVVVRPDPAGAFIEGFPSILDAAFTAGTPCSSIGMPGGPVRNNLWLASPLIEANSDGVVRSVHAWDTINSPSDFGGRLGGVAFLGAALLQEPVPLAQLNCFFPRGEAAPPSCAGTPLTLAGRGFNSNQSTSDKERIVFSIPYTAAGATAASDFGYAPSVIETVSAKDFTTQIQTRADLLSHAIVVIGGSYLASDDLYATPLGAGMPGAMIHANAIRAFAVSGLVAEQKSWPLKALLIVVAALIGALFQLFGALIRRHFPPVAGDLTEIIVSCAGIIVTVSAVFVIAVKWAIDDLGSSGTAIGTLTPAMAVAFEGLSTVLGQIKDLVHRTFTELARLFSRHLHGE